MDSLLLILITGFSAGAAHVYLGLDHLAALMPLSQGKPRWTALWLGLRWGLGHSLGVLLVALGLITIRELALIEIDIEQLGAFGDQVVGFLLIAIGIFGIRTALAEHVHSHPHAHGGDVHQHLHIHEAGHATDEQVPHQHHKLHAHTAIVAGLIQGVAGMSYLWGVLPSLALPLAPALWYLLCFAVGSIIAMGLFSIGFGMLSSRFEQELPNLVRQARVIVSSLCIAVGGLWLSNHLL